VVAEISDVIGLGMELYIKKKVDRLQDPSAYLLQRNKPLLDARVQTTNTYKASLDNVVKSVTGITNKKDAAYIAASKQLWVKSLARDITVKLASVELGIIDVKYPTLESIGVRVLVGCTNQQWCEGFGRRKEQLYFEGVGLKPLNTNV